MSTTTRSHCPHRVPDFVKLRKATFLPSARFVQGARSHSKGDIELRLRIRCRATAKLEKPGVPGCRASKVSVSAQTTAQQRLH